MWRASDELLGRVVAVKEVHPHSGSEVLDRRVERARREAQAIARVSDPHVLNLHDVVTHDERLWLVMEFVDGSSLAEYLATSGPMTPAQVAGVGLEVLDALEAVHAVGALHRDVKPANLLLRREGGVVLCDFGIAALAGSDSLTTSGEVVGSLEFIAPERLENQPAGPPSDLFSLGGTLCALLSGRSPFTRPEPAAVLHAVVWEEPLIPEAAGPLRGTLEALLRKDPAQRPTVAQTREALRRVASPSGWGASTGHPPGPGPDRPGTGGGSPGRRSLLFGAALLVTGGGAATAWWLDDRFGYGRSDDDRPDGSPSPRPNRIDAVMAAPDAGDVRAPHTYWLFSDDRYVRARIAKTGQPFRRLLKGPEPLSAWEGTFADLPVFQNRIDATLRVPDQPSEYWVFSGNHYIRIRIAGDTSFYQASRVHDRRPLSDWEGAFGDLLDDGLDALLPVPDDPYQVWMFAGDRYVRARLDDEVADGDTAGGQIAQGPAAISEWSRTLGKYDPFRGGIDAALPVPGEPNEYWVFSGTRYLRMSVADVSYEDRIVRKLARTPAWSTIP
nr:protein kinase [Streptomyces sp. AJS327]